MDTQNKYFYELNKKSSDLIYPHDTEIIVYRKVTTPEGKVQIIEIKTEYRTKRKSQRIVPPFEMTVEQFDYWKIKETEDAHKNHNKDKRETRNNVSIENLLETDLVSTESADYVFVLKEEEQYRFNRERIAKEIFSNLSPIQQKRYYMNKVAKKSTYEIAEEENVTNISVFESLQSAQARIDKELSKYDLKVK